MTINVKVNVNVICFMISNTFYIVVFGNPTLTISRLTVLTNFMEIFSCLWQLNSNALFHKQSRKPPAYTGIFVTQSPGPVFPEVLINSHFLKNRPLPGKGIHLGPNGHRMYE